MEKKKTIFFKIFDGDMIHTYIRQIVGDHDSLLSELICCVLFVDKIWPTVSNEQRWMAYMGLSHIYLYCDSIAEKLANKESYNEENVRTELEKIGLQFVNFIMDHSINFKDRTIFEQLEQKWNSGHH